MDISYNSGKIHNEGIAFTKATRNVLLRGTAAPLGGSVVSIFLRPGLMVGDTNTEPGFLKATRMIASRNNRGQRATVNRCKHVGAIIKIRRKV